MVMYAVEQSMTSWWSDKLVEEDMNSSLTQSAFRVTEPRDPHCKRSRGRGRLNKQGFFASLQPATAL